MALFLVATAVAPSGCASSGDASMGPGPGTGPAPTSADERDARIRELEAAMAIEQEALRVLISARLTERDDPLLTSDAMRSIANRLPMLQDELRGLLRALEISAEREERARELQRDP